MRLVLEADLKHVPLESAVLETARILTGYTADLMKASEDKPSSTRVPLCDATGRTIGYARFVD